MPAGTDRDLAVSARDTTVFDVGSHPKGPPHPDTAREGLREVGDRRAVAQALVADASQDLAAWIAYAKRAGLSAIEIADLAGITRQSVYDTLRHTG